MIAKVQGCLGGLKTDGKFGPLTQEALSNKNFPNGFTDKDVAVICNEVQPSPETPTPTVVLPTPDAEDNVDSLNV